MNSPGMRPETVARGVPIFRWRLMVPAACALAGLALAGLNYSLYGVVVESAGGGMPSGIVWGIATVGATILLLGYGVRRRVYRESLGTLQTWFWSHLCVSVLATVTFVLHTGLRIRGTFNALLAAVFISVVLTGLWGAGKYLIVRHRIVQEERAAERPPLLGGEGQVRLRGWVGAHAFLAVLLVPLLIVHIITAVYYR